jgi:AraC-like DNA-binding protein
VSKYKLIRDFKSVWDTTPGAYLRKVRLSQAAVLLCGSESVTSIAEKTGFNSLSYFTKCFHEAYGVTPAEWRRQHT